MEELDKLKSLEEKIGFSFENKDLLLEAMTHRSYLNERPSWPIVHNERLEFLGDAVLELVVTEFLFKEHKDPEGVLTSWRAALVNTVELAEISVKFDLNSFLLLSRGEAKDMGRARQSILANTVEALIGAMYLDQGYVVAQTFIERFIVPELPAIIKDKTYKDPKSLFQEEAQERMGVTPSYHVSEEWGPDHAKIFRIGVFLEEKQVGEGVGPSKQDAQRAAAEDGLKKMGW